MLVPALAALVCLGTAPGAEAQTLGDLTRGIKKSGKGTALFQTVEFQSKTFKALPQWARVVRSARRDVRSFRPCVQDASQCQSKQAKSWRAIVTAARAMSRKEKLIAVNKFFNRWPYKLDREVYGVSEYWAGISEFMRRSGDCEDYSIAKYYALKELGFKESELRIVILKDRIRNIGHAVLAVYEPNDILILDSLSNLILSHKKYKHYVPQYSMNETTRWAHIKS
ncbi:transglutaminase-like cysteine peptidase [Kiloniella sp. b19]|uniref:transglutaminase-like cysteine peptidase n=1 Tax=Kiloniella sp. GXU_MW_B19 TaxID=3141326 RepID=UPI0031E25B71